MSKNYFCKVCFAKLTSKRNFFKHMLTQHQQQYITTYQELYGKVKCLYCDNQPLFNQKSLIPKIFCAQHKSLHKKYNSCLCVQFYLKQGYTLEQAKQFISELQKNNSKQYNDCYSKQKLIEKGYTEEQAQQKVLWRRKHNPRCRDVHTQQQVNTIIQKATNTLNHTLSQKPTGYYRASSMNFYKTQHLSQHERRKLIRENGYCRDNPNFKTFKNPMTVKYYLDLGYSQIQATQLLKQRQTTFSLEKCILKYGEQKGLEIFRKRQEKWLNSLNTPENKEKIKAGQIKGYINAKIKNWSIISQQLFNQIMQSIQLTDFTVFYHDLNEQYKVITAKSFRFLDFYIKQLNLAIQFDGTYWHKNETQQMSLTRDNEIKEALPNIEILHIKEIDYINNKLDTINFIVEKIKEKINEYI